MKNLRPWQLAIVAILALWFLLALVRVFGQLLLFNLFWILPSLQFLLLGALVALNVFFAQGVMKDASAQSVAGRKIFFVAPEVWGLATLIGGLAVVIPYWVFHHSTLRRD